LKITPEENECKWKGFYNTFARYGFPEDELWKSWENHPGKKYGGNCPVTFTHVKESDILSIGDYKLRVIETPGHSPCHQCLYDDKNKILFCGDHILFDISPNITYWDELDNALKSYLENLDKVAKLEVKLVLPGHRRIMNDHRKRIEELKKHHGERLKEAMEAMGDSLLISHGILKPIRGQHSPRRKNGLLSGKRLPTCATSKKRGKLKAACMTVKFFFRE
jgi:glyoxylase-like metal-dependent hydrolase (beta-lactamase superfamily II)